MGELSQRLADLVQNGVYPNPVTFITQICATLILLYFLKRWVWKPMQEFLAKRSDVIVGELEGAKQARLEAEQMKVEYEGDLKSAKNEASNILENARLQAQELKQQMIVEAEKEASYKIEKATKEIESERSKIESELKSQLVDIAFQAAEKIINEKLDDQKNRNIIDKFINEVE